MALAYKIPDEYQAIRDAVREFGKNEIEPVAKEHDESREYPYEVVQKAADLDLVGPNIPEEYGGAGMDLIATTIVFEELWHADAGIGTSIASRSFGSEMLIEYGTEEQKEKWLPRITSGKSAMGTAISEPAHGSDVGGIETRAEKDGDEWVINGNKMWITNGSVADMVIVLAKTDPGKRHDGISAFIVPTDKEGFQPEKIQNKLGIHASDLAEIVIDNVRIPEENILGEKNKGFYQLMEFFPEGRVGVAGRATGIAQAALDAAVKYANEREQFGKHIKEFQAIQHKIAEMATKVETARSLTYRAASEVENGDEDQAAKLASMAKYYSSEKAVEVADEAIQVHGGAGYVTDHPVERYYRDSRITKIYEGTNEIQKTIISRKVL